MPLTHRGYSAHIEVEGEELPQFQVERTDKTMACWMPSESGKAFSNHIRTLDTHEHVFKNIRVFADGRMLQGRGSQDNLIQMLDHRVASATSKEPFVFSEVAFELADEDTKDDNSGHPSLAEDVGVIKITIHPAVQKFERTAEVRLDKGHAADNGIKLSEKSKLIGANHVRAGVAQPHTAIPSNRSATDTEKEPYAVFCFKHRPKALLQALGVMPRPVRPPIPPVATASGTAPRPRSPSSGTSPKPRRKRPRTEDDTGDDVKPVIKSEDDDVTARRQRLEAIIAASQAELAGLDGPASPSVKAERAPSPIRVPQHKEVIDLTDD